MFDKYRGIDEKDRPRWYEWSYDQTARAFKLKIDRLTMPLLEEKIRTDISTGKGTISYLARSQGAGKYATAFNKEFGFKKMLRRSGEDADMIEFTLLLPDAENMRYGRLRYPLLFVSANVTALSEMLFWPETGNEETDMPPASAPETGRKEQQLLTLRTITQKGRIHGGNISGYVSVGMATWLKSLGDTDLKECTAAMLDAANFMTGSDNPLSTAIMKKLLSCRDIDPKKLRGILWDILIDFNPRDFWHGEDESDFPAYVTNGKFVLDCPGDTCGLNPADSMYPVKNGQGYELGCHNVDNSYQQTLLLVGLLMLWQMARTAPQAARAQTEVEA
jgi:hypothetical protein